MIYDIFPMFNEIELLQIRLSELSSVIDKFVIVESDHSFRGLPKPYNFENNIKLFEKYLDKIEYIKTSIKDKHEDFHKNAAMESYTLKQCDKDDIIIFGDLDEIYKANFVRYAKMYLKDKEIETVSFDMPMFLYRLNGQVFENDKPFVWCGNVAFRPSLLKKYTLTQIRDHLRGKEDKTHIHLPESGWHFTSIGTNEQIFEKFNNWGHWSEIPERTLEYIYKCVESGKHFHPACGNLNVVYQKVLDFLPASIVYSGKINENFKHLIRI